MEYLQQSIALWNADVDPHHGKLFQSWIYVKVRNQSNTVLPGTSKSQTHCAIVTNSNIQAAWNHMIHSYSTMSMITILCIWNTGYSD